MELSPARYLVVARKWGDKELNKNRRTIKMGTVLQQQQQQQQQKATREINKNK